MAVTAQRQPFTRAIRRIEEVCDEELEPRVVLERVADEIRGAMPVDAVFASATDPETLLAMGAGLAFGLPTSICDPFWDYEFEVPDFHKFTDLARAPRSVGDLHAATGGHPERSPRWREFKTHGAFDAELRGTLNAGGRTWGLMHLNRDGEHGAFTADEVAFVDAVAPHVGRALRRGAMTAAADEDAVIGPGMALLDAHHRLRSASAEAIAWFERIRSYTDPVATDLGFGVPPEIIHVAQVARARAASGDRGVVSTRIRTGGGRWLLVHGSCTFDAEGAVDATAITVAQAAAADVAPLLIEAYELTPREVEVTQALARGLSTAEIALELSLSRWTVQDHLKRIYEKLGVSSRGGVVARLYADVFHPRLDVTHR